MAPCAAYFPSGGTAFNRDRALDDPERRGDTHGFRRGDRRDRGWVRDRERPPCGAAVGGVAAIHLLYGRSKYSDTLGVQPTGHRWVRRIREPLSSVTRRIRGREPHMQMNVSDLNRVFFLAQSRGIRAGGFRFTDHGGHLGVQLFFKRL